MVSTRVAARLCRSPSRRASPAALAPFVLVLVALAPGRAAAQNPPDAQSKDRVAEARKYYDAGRQAYEAGQFKVAAIAFVEANRLAPRPAILFSAAQAYRRQYFVDSDLANVERAIALYKQYLDEVPQGGRRNDAAGHLATLEPIWQSLRAQGANGAGGGNSGSGDGASTQIMVTSKTPGARAAVGDGELSEIPLIADLEPGVHTVRVEAPGFFPETTEGVAVRGRLVVVPVNLEPRPATITLDVPSGARVSIDGRTVTGRSVEVAAGPHFIAVTQRGHRPIARDLDLARGETFALDATLPMTTQRKLSYGLLVGSAALVASGAVTAGLAFSAQSQASSIRDTVAGGSNISSEDLARHNALLGDRDRWRRATYALWGVGFAVGVAGALAYWVDEPRPSSIAREARTPREPSAPIVVPTASPDGVGAAIRGSF